MTAATAAGPALDTKRYIIGSFGKASSARCPDTEGAPVVSIVSAAIPSCPVILYTRSQ
jgi:hypothetical protein